MDDMIDETDTSTDTDNTVLVHPYLWLQLNGRPKNTLRHSI